MTFLPACRLIAAIKDVLGVRCMMGCREPAGTRLKGNSPELSQMKGAAPPEENVHHGRGCAVAVSAMRRRSGCKKARCCRDASPAAQSSSFSAFKVFFLGARVALISKSLHLWRYFYSFNLSVVSNVNPLCFLGFFFLIVKTPQSKHEVGGGG